MCYNNRKKLKNKRIKIDLTKRRLTLLNQARAETSGKPSIDFVFADVNVKVLKLFKISLYLQLLSFLLYHLISNDIIKSNLVRSGNVHQKPRSK